MPSPKKVGAVRDVHKRTKHDLYIQPTVPATFISFIIWKKYLHKNKHKDIEEIKTVALSFFESQSKTFYKTGTMNTEKKY